MESDPITDSIGDFGRWQLWLSIIIILTKIPQSENQMAFLFLDHWPKTMNCADNPNASGKDYCKNCTKFVYFDQVFDETAIMTYNLVCDRAYLRPFIHSSFMLGNAFGNLAWGAVADTYGRKKLSIIAYCILVGFGMATSGAPEIISFLIFRFITGFGVGGIGLGFAILIESLGIKSRMYLSYIYEMQFSVGLALLAGFCLIPNWRYIYLTISSLSIIIIILIGFFLPESPRYLLTKGEIDRSTIILKKAAKMNKMPVEGIRERLQLAYEFQKSQEPKNKIKFYELFIHKTYGLRIFIVSQIFMGLTIALFGTFIFLGRLDSNFHVNIALAALIGVPGYFLCIFFSKIMGRKPMMMIFSSVSAVGMLTLIMLNIFLKESQYSPWFQTLACAIAVVGMSSTVPSIFLVACELFPTVMRTTAIGVASFSSNMGSIAAPFIMDSELTIVYKQVILLLMIIYTTILIAFLPESKNMILRNSIERTD